MQLRTRLATVLTTASALIVLTSACANDGTTVGPGVDLGNVKLVAALQPFDKCGDFLAYVQGEAAKRVTAYGLDGSGGAIAYDATAPVTTASGMARSESAAAAPVEAAPMAKSDSGMADAADPTNATGTNNQEADVDEADIVKTDGNRIVTLRNNELIVVTLTDGAPHVTSRLPLGVRGDRLFLLPDRAYVIGSPDAMTVYDGGPQPTVQSVLVAVALTGEPAVAHRSTVDGTILDGRLANGALRLVLSSAGGSQLGFVYPSGDGSKSVETAENTNKTIVDDSALEDWVPGRVGEDGKRTPLLDCDHLYRPAELSGFSMLSILTISDGLDSLTGTGLLADGQTTYASADHLYVATNQWADLSDEPTGANTKRSPAAVAEHTDVHSFSIAGTEPATYEASGRVDGHVLNQYSMSEADDDLRIATTVGPNFGTNSMVPSCPPDADCAEPQIIEDSAGSASSAGDSQIVVLRPDGDVLEEIGKVDGLGVSEQIKSVRYVGDTAYVVTFRQTDPFYVVDLSDPTAPKKLGELKVPGFSSYLHPVGEHLVLGVGSDATTQGRITGAKLSLYDTTDPAAPKEITTWMSPDIGFQVDNDPHAFSWDADRQTAYLPYYASCSGFGGCQVNGPNGVLVVKVADGAITELGRIDHQDRTPSPDAPPTTAPETTVPETTVPETTVPETSVPETTIPDATTTVPDPTVPDTTVITEVPPTTVVAKSDGAASSSGSGSGSSAGSSGIAAPPIGIAPLPLPTEPYCDPAACDPAPYAYQPTIIRVFVIGDRVITLSDAGIAAHDVATLKLAGFAAF